MDGNLAAQRMLAEVFEVTDRTWRGIGRFRERLAARRRLSRLDAAHRFDVTGIRTEESPLCTAARCCRARSSQPVPRLRHRVHPRTPLGVTMVSSEGACAAYYHYGRFLDAAPASHA